MSDFPFSLDSDSTLPRVDDNITEIGADAINALRAAMFNVEAEIGIGASGTAGSIAQRLNVSLLPDGSISPSILLGLLVNLGGIVDSQISPTAGIQESKLSLSFSTSSLYNLYVTLKASVDVLNGFLSLTGIKLEPHIDGTNYNHLLSAIHVDHTPAIVKTSPSASPSDGTNVINRTSTNADLLIKDLSDDLVVHEKSNGTPGTTATSGGTVPPINYGHTAGGIYVDSSLFSSIPQNNNDVQKVIDYFDNSSLLLLGSRTQNLYANGISRTSRSSSLIADGYGEPLIPSTPATAYLLSVPPGPPASSPVDDFAHGDDVILFNPTATQLSSFNFDAQFAQVNPGDLLTINYGTGISLQFIIDSTKKIVSGIVRTYAVRINGKNPISDGYASARIDRALFHRNKFGVLATERAPSSVGELESLIVVNPRAAVALGNGFNPSEFDSTHYNLYLKLLPNGDTTNIYGLAPIDVTGNLGTTPGAYTLEQIINNINTAFRSPGFNYRFVAFGYKGQIGIALADHYNNASFSIVSGVVDGYGNYTSSSGIVSPNNVVDNFNLIDPMGFGLAGSNIASPPPAASYSNLNAARFAPTLFFYPLKRNFFYTDGVERDRLKSDPIILDSIQDANGNGFWPATIITVNVLPSRVEVVYRVDLDLSASGIAIGKTIVVQPATSTINLLDNVNYGRFIISNIGLNNCNTPNAFTNITVYDAVHGTGVSPFNTLQPGTAVNVYFSDDSVSFDAENVFDDSSGGPYKRFFENYVDAVGHTFTHERARFIATGSDIQNINLFNVSPKLRGYSTSNNDKEIRLVLSSYDDITGEFDGYLARWNPLSSTVSNLGPLTSGKKGEPTRFYDETNIDYIDFIFTLNDSISAFTNKNLDIQLFKSLQLDNTVMCISTCQVNDVDKKVSYLKDAREFGNVSEEQLTDSAIDFINAPDRLLRENGIISGFDLVSGSPVNQISFSGGIALVNGKVVLINDTTVTAPVLQEMLLPSLLTSVGTITWFVCVNDKSEIELVASTDYSLSLSGTYGTLDHNRLFYVSNPNVTGQTPYIVRSGYLNDIVLNKKDIVPIYAFTANITGSPPNVAVTGSLVFDLRRFISNGYNGRTDAFVLGKEGNFRTLTAAKNYINYLVAFRSGQSNENQLGLTVIVKDSITLSSTIFLDFPVKVSFIGDPGTFNIPIATGLEIGNNIEFKNITFNYTYDATSDGSFNANNVSNYSKSCILCNVDATTGVKNISIIDCSFTSSNVNRFTFISVIFGTNLYTAQNIKIRDNLFTTTATGNDQYAVISFVGPTSAPSTSSSARLVDTLIDNNICNKNQLISIGAVYNSGGGTIVDAITGINVKLTNNICGAINVLTRQVKSLNIANGSFVLDKDNLIIVDSNTCRFIYSGTDTGLVEATAGRVDTRLGTGLFSGSYNISNNVCSWIHTGVKIPSSYSDEIPNISISNNKLNAFDPAFLTPYYFGFTAPNIAVIADRVAGS